jgi:tetratricopeptide (TPR) repeat protein
MIHIRGVRASFIFLAILNLLLTGCNQDTNEQSNILFVQAWQLLQRADNEQDNRVKMDMLLLADEKLKTITEKYPSSNVAVMIATGSDNSKLLRDSILKAKREVCFDAPAKACVLSEASVIANSVKDSTGYGRSSKVLIYSKIAAEQFKSGFLSDGARSLNRALDAYKEEPKSFSSLVSVVAALIEAGRDTEIENILDMPDTSKKCAIIISVSLTRAISSKNEATNKRIMPCLEAKTFMPDSSAHASVLAQVANVQARMQLRKEAAANIERARHLAPLVPTFGDDHARTALLVMVKNTLEAEIMLGEKEKAKTFFDRVLSIIQTNRSFRNDSLSALFQHDGVIATIINVRQIADETADEVLRSNILASGAIARADLGQLAEAELLANSIRSDYSQALALASIARAQQKANMRDKAADTAKKAFKIATGLREPEQSVDCLINIAEALPN